jgi:hypothetical protein
MRWFINSSVIGSIFRTLHNHLTAFELQIKHFKQFHKLFFAKNMVTTLQKHSTSGLYIIMISLQRHEEMLWLS